MLVNEDSWPHQVEIRLTRTSFSKELREIQAWLQSWEIPYRLPEVMDDNAPLRVRFAEAKFARAFQLTHGATLVPDDEVERAMMEDENNEAEYQSLANDRRR